LVAVETGVSGLLSSPGSHTGAPGRRGHVSSVG
jgi:hypothetical protein